MEIKDVIHLYIGCECEFDNVGIATVAGIDRAGNVLLEHYRDGLQKVAPPSLVTLKLRPLSDMTEGDFKNLFKTDKALFLFTKLHWYGCYLDDEDVERAKDASPTEIYDMLTEYEEANYDNIICFTKYNPTFSHGGLDEEMFYNMEIKTYSSIINDLRRMGFDCDGLINAGLALDKTKT